MEGNELRFRSRGVRDGARTSVGNTLKSEMNTILYRRIAKRFGKGQPDQNWVVTVERENGRLVVKHGNHEACAQHARAIKGFENGVLLERRGK
jgi:hypothetical protein